MDNPARAHPLTSDSRAIRARTARVARGSSRIRYCLRPGCTAQVERDGYCPHHSQTVVNQVIGPPCSGKTTYVLERAKLGDLLVDWDTLMTALSGKTGHSRDAALIGYVAEARDAIIARLRQRRAGTEPPTAWIVSSRRLNLGLPGTVHVMDTPMDQCLKRLHATPDGRDIAEAEAAIRQWHAATT